MSTKPTVEVTETNFETEVLKSNQPVLVGFATGWSLPSMTLDGVLEEIARESIDYLKVVRVKLDHSPNLGLWYGIRCIPTMLCFVDGEERVGIFGTTSKEAILSQVKLVINSRCMPEPGFARFNKKLTRNVDQKLLV
jgi:thioredoxin 1